MGNRASILYKSQDENGNEQLTHAYSHRGAHDGWLKFNNGITADDPDADGAVEVLEDEDVTVDDITGTFDADSDDLDTFESVYEWKQMIGDDVSYEVGYVVDTTTDEWTVRAFQSVERVEEIEHEDNW